MRNRNYDNRFDNPSQQNGRGSHQGDSWSSRRSRRSQHGHSGDEPQYGRTYSRDMNDMNEREYPEHYRNQHFGGEGSYQHSYGSTPSSRSTSDNDNSFFESDSNWSSEKNGRFYGKGPKGYKRSDDRLREEVCEALSRHSDIDASEIEVNVKDGELTLTGSVDSRRTKRLAEDVCENISGIKDVQNQIKISSSGSDSDTSGSESGRRHTSGSQSSTSGTQQRSSSSRAS